MKKIKLIRISRTPTETFGVLVEECGRPICCTLELPWRDNKRNVSCIPQGVYKGFSMMEKTVDIRDVPNRDGIQIHTGNTHKDIRGCILVGERFGILEDRKTKEHCNAVLASRPAMAYLQGIISGDFEIEVVERF